MLICHMGNTSEKILQTTFELLAERGYANISMRLIAKKAGVAVSQLTYYYRTKENLISSVIDAVIERSEDALQQRLRSGKLPPAAIFADACGKFDPKYFAQYLTEKYSGIYGL